MDLHLLCRTAGISASCEWSLMSGYHSITSPLFLKYLQKNSKFIPWGRFYPWKENILEHEERWAVFSGGHRVCSQCAGEEGGYISLLTWDFLLSFHVSKKCLHFVVSHLCFSHSMLAILHLTFALPDLNSSNVCLTPPLCFFCIHPLFQQLGRRLGFTNFAGSIFLNDKSLLSCRRRELIQGMDCTLSVRLLTPHWSLSSWEHRGLGFASFGLGHVQFEGEGGW